MTIIVVESFDERADDESRLRAPCSLLRRCSKPELAGTSAVAPALSLAGGAGAAASNTSPQPAIAA